MARPRSASGSIDDLGHLITAAYGLDRDWDAEAHCRPEHYVKASKTIPSPWQFDPNQKVTYTNSDGRETVIKGRDMIEAALLVCHSCPAQYDCATYAVQAEVLAGTWAMRIYDLTWLRRQPNWRELIADARRRRRPLQKAIPGQRVFVGLRRGSDTSSRL